MTCPWCGTIETETRTNCKNCGGPLPVLRTVFIDEDEEFLFDPPPLPPRQISDSYVKKIAASNALFIMSFVFSIVGGCFGLVGFILTILLITAVIGIPFLILGTVILVFGIFTLKNQYELAKEKVNVLRIGEATEGKIASYEENKNITVNKKHPKIIKYEFFLNYIKYTGEITTYKDLSHLYYEGKKVWILYMPENPEKNTLYPHP
ncbi:hypothetical protein JXA84_04195 [candidate division WOR-3 bacterium]|nr:hypothetical protein [candidate division WOR-3 bacterium]